MIWKLIFLFFGLVILKALRDKWTIEWAVISGDSKRDKKIWHFVGFAILVWVAFWGVYLVKPLSFNLGAIVLMIGFITWWIFDIALNLFRGLSWNHIGDSDSEKFLNKNIFAIKMIGLMLSILLVFLTS